MAVITQTQGVVTGYGSVNVTRTALSASDTLTFVKGSHQILSLYNTTAALVTINAKGSAPSALNPDGYGKALVTTAGYDIAVPANGWTIIDLDDIWAFLDGNGTVTLLTGTGVTAALYV
jgi:hypothetical protein